MGKVSHTHTHTHTHTVVYIQIISGMNPKKLVAVTSSERTGGLEKTGSLLEEEDLFFSS